MTHCDRDAQACVIDRRHSRKATALHFSLIPHHTAKGDAGRIHTMQTWTKLPANTEVAIDHTGLCRPVIRWPTEDRSAQPLLISISMGSAPDSHARSSKLARAPQRTACSSPVDAEPQLTSPARRRLGRDLLAGQALAAQSLDLLNDLQQHRLA